MTRGIYIVANDRVQENAIALLNSIRRHNQSVPVVIIPFNEEYHQVFNTLNRLHDVQLFPNLEFLEELTQKVGAIFDRDLKLPNKMRKLAVWFGPLQDFLYIDTDIIVFEDIAANLDYYPRSIFSAVTIITLAKNCGIFFPPSLSNKISSVKPI